MAFLDDLQSHCGGLVRLPTQLYWYWPRGRGWDGTPGRVCLLLDAVPITADDCDDLDARITADDCDDLDARTAAAAAAYAAAAADAYAAAAAHLLIDGHPRWVRVTEKDVEVIDEAK